eukprot:8145878-Heterocapsa_arctica.AAC.1
MSLFARSLGGIASDWANARWRMQGRLWGALPLAPWPGPRPLRLRLRDLGHGLALRPSSCLPSSRSLGT